MLRPPQEVSICHGAAASTLPERACVCWVTARADRPVLRLQFFDVQRVSRPADFGVVSQRVAYNTKFFSFVVVAPFSLSPTRYY